MEQKILRILEKDGRATAKEIANELCVEEKEVEGIIADLEEKGIIGGYKAMVNWDKFDQNLVSALIELKVTPQRNRGFDRLAERIYQFPEVKAINLMSGSYDFGITVEGKNIKEISLFVSEHLAPMESVISTSTHFVLKRYKYDGIICSKPHKDEREVISLWV